MEKFLKDRSYYENLYEKRMIRTQKSYHEKFNKSTDNLEKWVLNFAWLLYKMSDYAHRDETIDEWMEQDRASDEFFENTKPFRDIVRCKFCNSIMDIEDKDFFGWYDWNPNRVLFLYKCNQCNKRRGFYNNWEELESKKEYCDKCWFVIIYKAKFNWDILVKNYSCESCWNKYTKEEDFSVEKIQEEIITEDDIKMYWYNEKEAREMKESYDSIDRLKAVMDEINEKKKQEDYTEKLNNLIKYNLFQLEEFINKSLEKTEYKNFKIINKENIKTYMKCDFEVYFTWNFWEKTIKTLDKLLNDLLSNTNWKIPKNAIDEKLWILTWKIYGYDREEDLIELIKSR